VRKTPLPRRTASLARSTKGLTRWVKVKPLNAERRARRKKRYAAYLASAAWKRRRREALARAGYRCEMVLLDRSRCPEVEKLTVHHRTYARFGAELPADLVVLCKGHHDEHHALTGKGIALGQQQQDEGWTSKSRLRR
jgi:hypothetical protein